MLFRNVRIPFNRSLSVLSPLCCHLYRCLVALSHTRTSLVFDSRVALAIHAHAFASLLVSRVSHRHPSRHVLHDDRLARHAGTDADASDVVADDASIQGCALYVPRLWRDVLARLCAWGVSIEARYDARRVRPQCTFTGDARARVPRDGTRRVRPDVASLQGMRVALRPRGATAHDHSPAEAPRLDRRQRDTVSLVSKKKSRPVVQWLKNTATPSEWFFVEDAATKNSDIAVQSKKENVLQL